MSKLLIVDDEVDVREFAKNFFQRRKIEVIVSSSGEEALDLLVKEKPDLVLLDVRLGGMDGIEVLQKMRQMQNNTQVIMVTGVDEKETSDKAKELGVTDYIHKPLKLDELEEVVLKRLLKTGNKKAG
ncbi:MAG: response regulator [Candidatus Omnitrophica bacterium]|nr:response regulator [Candidatus Omnitrophota bacterium]